MATKKSGPFISSARANKRAGKTVAPGGTVNISARGKAPLSFKKGALHKALGVPQGQTIPAGKKADALAGKYGPNVKKMANFAFKGALAQGRKTRSKGK
jgi:hypothetical protein